MAATPVSDQIQSPSHGEQSPARYPSEDQGLCGRCQEWDLTELYQKFTARKDNLHDVKALCNLGTLHENCRLCRILADSYKYKFSEVVSAAEDLRLLVAPYDYACRHPDETTQALGNVLAVNDGRPYHWGGAKITMSLEEPGDVSDPRTDDWSRQPCNVSWLRRCMRQCVEEHRECQADPAHQFDAPVYFIDCDARKLCKATQDMPYTALSYVWGKEHPNDGASEMDCFTALPALLPRTLENAMTLTTQLGMRYLWVDRYCITNSEEDSATKHDQLGTMDQIYDQAEVTIVSLGDGPSTGLPGVGGTPRWTRPQETIKGYTFRTTFRDPRYVIKDSKWHERGWTFQEAYLSRRKIYLTPEEAVFECSVALRSEVEDCLSPLTHLPIKYSPEFNSARLFSTTGVSISLTGLILLINTYLDKKLTYQSDVLNAFRGILGKSERGPFAVQHYWGLPIYEDTVERNGERPLSILPKLLGQQHGCGQLSSKFAASLTWSFYHRDGCRRRSGFPSWSWAGWEGTDCFPGFRTPSIGDVHVWIELNNREILHIDNFSSAGAFNLPPSQMSPYIHIECLTAPARIGNRMIDTKVFDGVRHGKGHKEFACVELQKTDGLQIARIPDVAEDYRFAEDADCKLIVLGDTAAENGGLGFIMVVKEKAGFYERIGSLTKAHSKKNINWAVKRANGEWDSTGYIEIPKFLLQKEKIRLG